MKAIILAAGQSSRLYPRTLTKPKCLLEINKKKIINYQIDWLNQCGINDIIVVVGYLSDLIINELGDKVRYRTYKDYFKTNNLSTLNSIRDELDEDTIILFSDVLLSYELLKKCINSKDDFNLIIDKNNISDKTMRVVIKNDLIFDIGGHIPISKANANFIGIAKFSKLAASALRQKISFYANDRSFINSYYTSVLIDLAKNNYKIKYTDVKNEPWIEIDDEADYKSAIDNFVLWK